MITPTPEARSRDTVEYDGDGRLALPQARGSASAVNHHHSRRFETLEAALVATCKTWASGDPDGWAGVAEVRAPRTPTSHHRQRRRP